MTELPSKAKVSFGLFLGVGSGAWSAIIAFLCVPWYVSLLGIESYGLIGFFAVLQATIGILDLGVGATINREVARSHAIGDVDRPRRLLRSLELIYATVSVIIATAIWLSAPLVAKVWLGLSTLESSEIVRAIQLMGVVVALRWPVGLYHGSLIGLHRAEVSYGLTVGFATLANVGAVIFLLYFSKSVASYFVWQATASLIYAAGARRSAWRALGGRVGGTGFDYPLVRGVLIQSVTMSGVAVSGLILTQLDKFVVSSSVSLADFGRYSLAIVLASGLTLLLIPAFNVVYPRLSALVAAGRSDEQVKFYRLGTRLFLSCLFPVALSAYFYSRDLLTIWTGDAALAEATAPIAGLLCLGTALNGVMHFPYALQLATGRTKIPLLINCLLIVIMLPLAVTLVEYFGSLGGALAWFSLNAIYVVIGMVATHSYLLPGLWRRWLFQDVGPAALITSTVVIAGAALLSLGVENHGIRLILGAAVAILATMAALFTYHDTRAMIFDAFRDVSARLRRLRLT